MISFGVNVQSCVLKKRKGAGKPLSVFNRFSVFIKTVNLRRRRLLPRQQAQHLLPCRGVRPTW